MSAAIDAVVETVHTRGIYRLVRGLVLIEQVRGFDFVSFFPLSTTGIEAVQITFSRGRQD